MTSALRIILRMTLMCGLLLFGTLSAFAQQSIKFAHTFDSSSALHLSAVWAADEIKEDTDGRYEITVYPHMALGTQTDLVRALDLGTVDVVYVFPAALRRQYSLITFLQAPYMFDDAEALLDYAGSDSFQELVDGYQYDTGHMIQGWTYYAQRHLSSKTPVFDPEDLNGMQIGVSPGSPTSEMFITSLGQQAVPLPFVDSYYALGTGTIDALETSLPNFVSMRLYEVQNHISLTGHMFDTVLTIVAGNLWTGLSDEDKAIFTRVLSEAARRASEQFLRQEQEHLQNLQDMGVQIYAPEREVFSRRTCGTPGCDKFSACPQSIFERKREECCKNALLAPFLACPQ